MPYNSETEMLIGSENVIGSIGINKLSPDFENVSSSSDLDALGIFDHLNEEEAQAAKDLLIAEMSSWPLRTPQRGGGGGHDEENPNPVEELLNEG